MDNAAKAAAVRDLAEYGIVYVNTAQDALEVSLFCPVMVTVTPMDSGIYRIEELREGRVIIL